MNQITETIVENATQFRLGAELKNAAETLSDDAARFLVDRYYQIQEMRKGAANQKRAVDQGADKGPDTHPLLAWQAKSLETMEGGIKAALDVFSSSHPVGRVIKSTYGVGPVITAGLLAHIDIQKAPTVGHIWSFADLNPNRSWLGKEKAKQLVEDTFPDKKRGTSEEDIREIAMRARFSPGVFLRRVQRVADEKHDGKITRKLVTAELAKPPYNAELKTLCWKIGQSFMKFSGQDKCYYGKLYREKKQSLIRENEAGKFADAAAANVKKCGPTTEAHKLGLEGKLSAGHIDARARRWVVKLFLSHVHHVWYKEHFKEEPPKPYIITQGEHAHLIHNPMLNHDD